MVGAGVLMAGNALAYEDGPYCREYTQQVTIGGKLRQAYGTACLQENGAWQIVSRQMEGEEALPPVQAPEQVVIQQPVIQYVEPVYVRRFEPQPWPFSLSLGYSSYHGGGHGWHHGHRDGWR